MMELQLLGKQEIAAPEFCEEVKQAVIKANPPLPKSRPKWFFGKKLMNGTKYLTMAELEAGLDTVRKAPKNEVVLELSVWRPQIERLSAFPNCSGS